MEFIWFEEEDLDQNRQKNDEEELNLPAEDDDFVDEKSIQEESEEPSFSRFINQTRDLNEVLNCDDGSRLERRDLLPEMFIAEGRENVDFNEFDERAKLLDKFKKTIRKFEGIDAKESFLVLFYLVF